MQLTARDGACLRGRVGRLAHVLVMASVLIPLLGHAQIVPTWREEYEKRLKYGDLVEPLKGDIFGEKVNLYDGSVSLASTDVSVPGNNGLSVSLSRNLGDLSGSVTEDQFGNWSLDVPSLSGVYVIFQRPHRAATGRPVRVAQR